MSCFLLDIAPYVEQNLISANICNDEAYDMFVNTLTQAEQISLTPTHVQVRIVRLRTNSVPFSSHGTICYPLRTILQARCLPWYEFHELPFVIMPFNDKLGAVHESTIDMEKIRRAREFMTRKLKCPVYGTERHFYRFCKDIPFDNENMRQLSEELEHPSRRSHPKRLRTLRQDDIHRRSEKCIGSQELLNWFESGYAYGKIIWEKFQVMCAKENGICNIDQFLEKIKLFVAQRE